MSILTIKIIGFLLGCIFGSLVTIFAMAMCSIAKKADEESERYWDEH